MEFTLDNATSCETVPATAQELGHKVLDVYNVNDTTWKILIKKS